MTASIEIIQGDITQQDVEAVVNAANTTLLGGGGVDGAIHRAAGPELLEACRSLGGCPTGEARITPGFRLHARWIIHTVGPVWPARRRFDHDLPAPTEAARPSQPGALLRRSRRFAKAGGHRNNNGKDGHPGEDALLAGCYRHCFSLAETHRIATIAFPSISTGAYRFPVERAARIAWSETRRFLKTNRTLRKVVFVCFDATTYDCYRRIAAEKPVDNEA